MSSRDYLGAALGRRAPFLELYRHLLLNLGLKGRRGGTNGRVVGVDGEGDLPCLERLAKTPVALEGLRAIVVRRGQRLSRRSSRLRWCGLSGTGHPLRLGGRAGGSDQGHHAQEEKPEAAHRRSSSW